MIMQDELADQDREVLDFAALRFQYAGGREEQIRQRLDMTPTAYAQRLNRLLDSPAAAIYSPTVVARLRRLRDQRLRAKGVQRAS